MEKIKTVWWKEIICFNCGRCTLKTNKRDYWCTLCTKLNVELYHIGFNCPNCLKTDLKDMAYNKWKHQYECEDCYRIFNKFI